MTSIAIIQRDTILEKLSSGLRLSEIAPQIGVTPQALSKALKDDPEYRSAIEAGFHCRLDQAERNIDEAANQVDVSRAGTKFRALAWRAEREFPERWSARSSVEHSGPGGGPIPVAVAVAFVSPALVWVDLVVDSKRIIDVPK